MLRGRLHVSGGGSDTTILLHLSADRKRAYGVSIPRDSMVDRPACDHGAIPAQDYAQWNAAYAIGGPACTIQQFEQLTGIRIDHYLVVDFAGFKDMVDAVDGVEAWDSILLTASPGRLRDGTGFVVVVGRRGGPEFADSEIARLGHLCGLAVTIANS